jgi:hypothetical protein
LLPSSSYLGECEGRFVAVAVAVAVAFAKLFVAVAAAVAVAMQFYVVVKLRRDRLARLYSVARNTAQWNKCSSIRTRFECGSNRHSNDAEI